MYTAYSDKETKLVLAWSLISISGLIFSLGIAGYFKIISYKVSFITEGIYPLILGVLAVYLLQEIPNNERGES